MNARMPRPQALTNRPKLASRELPPPEENDGFPQNFLSKNTTSRIHASETKIRVATSTAVVILALLHLPAMVRHRASSPAAEAKMDSNAKASMALHMSAASLHGVWTPFLQDPPVQDLKG